MKIAVIGAGIAGLTAGRELANAGHEVVVFEEQNDFGGRLATYAGKDGNKMIDFGLPYFKPTAGEFGAFLQDLVSKDLLKPWEGKYAKYSDGSITDVKEQPSYFVATKGMSQIGKYLGRMVDMRMGTKVGGLTHIGANRSKKRAWMLSFPTALTESFDAVIIATTARHAYALLNTTIDEIETLTMVREIDEIDYSSQFVLLAGYGDADKPEWNALDCDDDVVSWISNESSKNNDEECTLVIQSTPEFAYENRNGDSDVVAEKMAERVANILGEGWAALPDWHQLHFWKYSQAKNPLSHDFMEIKNNKETPLALIGGYMNGNDVESAYLSGLKLARKWVDIYAGQEKKPA